MRRCPRAAEMAEFGVRIAKAITCPQRRPGPLRTAQSASSDWRHAMGTRGQVTAFPRPCAMCGREVTRSGHVDVRVMRPVVMPGTYGGGHVRPLRYATEARAYLCPACARRVMGVLRVG